MDNHDNKEKRRPTRVELYDQPNKRPEKKTHFFFDKKADRTAKKEAAPSRYIYFEAMPAGTLFVNMKRLRERLLLTTPIRTQNQIIRKAMRELESIGYLDYQEVKKGRDIQFQIFKRSPKLALAKQG